MNIHEGIKPYTCGVCGKSFTRSDHFKLHSAIHGDVTKLTYVNQLGKDVNCGKRSAVQQKVAFAFNNAHWQWLIIKLERSLFNIKWYIVHEIVRVWGFLPLPLHLKQSQYYILLAWLQCVVLCVSFVIFLDKAVYLWSVLQVVLSLCMLTTNVKMLEKNTLTCWGVKR